MREIASHRVNPANDRVRILVMDAPGAGGASHEYRILIPHPKESCDDITAANLFFQNGAIAEAGVNGITHEALLAIVVDRLEAFQAGPYSCEENLHALHALREAQRYLHSRTLARMARGVEGTLEP